MNTSKASNVGSLLKSIRRSVDDYLEGIREELENVSVLIGPVKILNEVGKEYGLTNSQICAKCQIPKVVMARQISQYLMHELLNMTYPEITRNTGLSDHTTVLHSVRKITRMRASNPDFDKRISEIEARLDANGIFKWRVA